MAETLKSRMASAQQALRQGNPNECRRLLSALTLPANPDAATARLWAMSRDMLGRANFLLGGQSAALAAFAAGADYFRAYLQKNSSQDRQDLFFFIDLLQNLSFAFLEAKQFDQAFAAGNEALQLAEKYAPDSSLLANVLFRMSAIYYRSLNYDQAETLTARALQIWQTVNNEKMIGECLNNLGRIYEERGQLEEGIAWHEKAVRIRRRLPDVFDLAFSLGNLGAARASAGQWAEARKNLEEAIEIYGENGQSDSADCKGFAANLEICRQALQA